jgi:hypothetical protein
MPFPAAMAIAKFALPAIGGALGGLLGRSSGRAKTAEEKTGINQLIGAGDEGFAGVNRLQPVAQNFLQQGSQTFQPSIDYWTKILSGDRSEITGAVAPEIGRISTGYDQAAKTAGQFAPMGGGRSSLMAELPFRKAQDISTLISGLRPQAAQQLSGIAAQLSQLGLDAEQIIAALLQGVRGGGEALSNIGLKSRGLTAASTAAGAQGGAEIGKSIYDMLKQK